MFLCTGQLAQQTMSSHHKELVLQSTGHKVSKTSEERKRRGSSLDRRPSEVSVKQTPFEKAVCDLTHNQKLVDDLTFGRRIGFYELRGEIGSGNFSQVKLGIHDLTKGEKKHFKTLNMYEPQTKQDILHLFKPHKLVCYPVFKYMSFNLILYLGNAVTLAFRFFNMSCF